MCVFAFLLLLILTATRELFRLPNPPQNQPNCSLTWIIFSCTFSHTLGTPKNTVGWASFTLIYYTKKIIILGNYLEGGDQGALQGVPVGEVDGAQALGGHEDVHDVGGDVGERQIGDEAFLHVEKSVVVTQGSTSKAFGQVDAFFSELAKI